MEFTGNKILRREELAELVRVHQAHIFRYLRYLGAHDSAREDIVQETFLAAMQSTLLRQLDEWAQGAYLRGIARNQFRKACRQQKRSSAKHMGHESAMAEAELVWAKEFLRGGDGFDYIEALRKCRNSLPPRQKSLLDMQYAERKSRSVIAGSMGMSIEGVKTLGRRVRAALRECVHKRLKRAEQSW